MCFLKKLPVFVSSWLLLCSFQFYCYVPQNRLITQKAKEIILKRHNHYRALVGVPPLKWSNELADFAQEWAEKLARKCELQHRTEDKYGENIYWHSTKQSPDGVVDYWAREEKLFNHKNRTFKAGKGYGHYSQIIWRNTKYIGAGVANCSNGAQIWVCNYDPPGNWHDQKVY